jgi:hypothetical protein
MSNDKQHKINCNSCGREFDMRDLSQVFAHEECNGIPVDYTNLEKINSSAQKIGEPILHILGHDDVGLN